MLSMRNLLFKRIYIKSNLVKFFFFFDRLGNSDFIMYIVFIIKKMVVFKIKMNNLIYIKYIM